MVTSERLEAFSLRLAHTTEHGLMRESVRSRDLSHVDCHVRQGRGFFKRVLANHVRDNNAGSSLLVKLMQDDSVS